MAPQMKGLTQFIMDLRAAQDATEERKRINVEISNIRSKFESSLTSYQQRKYVCKLIYIHLLGLTKEVAFGLEQAYDLVRSKDYLEKQLGYLLISILLNRSGVSQLTFAQDLIERIHLDLIRDLRVDSDDINALALQFIASNFNFSLVDQDSSLVISNADPTIELWQEISQLIYGLCMSPTTSKLVRKKASAALLVILSLVPSELVANDNWIPRLLSLIDDPDLSLILSAVPLASFLTDYKHSYAKAIMPSVAQRLHSLVVDAKCPQEDYYYDMPLPWLVVKLLQLAERYFIRSGGSDSLDANTIQKIRLVVSKSIQNALVPRQAQTSRNAHSAVLFQAVSIATYLDASNEALSGAVNALVQLVESLETNTRYLALDTLVKLVARSDAKIPFVEHLNKIYSSLHNKDISVRRKGIDLLYIVCDESVYTQIVNQLLDYYPSAESILQSDIGVKVALIAERFATDLTWYVSTMLRLLSLNASGVSTELGATGGEIWERVVQVTVNNEELTIKACKYIVNLLGKSRDTTFADSLIKASAFILGEFGYKLANANDVDKEQFGVNTQFRILYNAYFTATLQTRPLILSSFLKFINRFPEADFVPDIMDILEAETLSLDLEIQKRANECLKIATLLVGGNEEDIAFARSLLAPLPPFERKQNQLLRQLGSIALVNRRSSSFNKSVVRSASSNGSAQGGMSVPTQEKDPFRSENEKSRTLPLSSNWYGGYHRMLQYDAGIFYEDLFVKITYKVHRSGPAYTVGLTIINNAARTAGVPLNAFTVHDLEYENDGTYVATITKNPDLTISDKTSMEIETKICDLVKSNSGPILVINYKCSGSFNYLRLKIPVALLKSLTGTTMSSIDDFKKRWVQIGTSLGTENGEFEGFLTAPHKYNCPFLASSLQRVGFAIVQKTPDNPDAKILITAASILRTLKSNYGVLLLLRSTDLEAKKFQLTVRSTSGGLSALMFQLIREIFNFQT